MRLFEGKRNGSTLFEIGYRTRALEDAARAMFKILDHILKSDESGYPADFRKQVEAVRDQYLSAVRR